MAWFTDPSDIRARAGDARFWRDLAIAYACAVAFGAAGGALALPYVAALHDLAHGNSAGGIGGLTPIETAVVAPAMALVFYPFAVVFALIPAAAAAPLFVAAGLVLAPRRPLAPAFGALAGGGLGAPVAIAAYGAGLPFDAPSAVVIGAVFGACAGWTLWRRILAPRLGPAPQAASAAVRTWRRIPLPAKALGVAIVGAAALALG